MPDLKKWYGNSKSRSYLEKAQKLLRKKDVSESETSENSDAGEKIQISSKEALEKQIDKYKEDARTEIENAKRAHGDLEDQRSAGLGKAAERTQSFLASFSDFLNGYTGIVECVQAADNQFGGLAYGILATFLRVAASKRDQEDLLEAELQEITRWFPHLETWTSIYPNTHLEKPIAEVYTDIIEFAKEGTQYYGSSTSNRLKKALEPPGKTRIEQSVQQIRENLVHIRRDCEVLMHERIHDLGKTVDELNEKVEQLNKLLVRHKEDHEVKYMASLRQTLHLPEDRPSHEEELRRYEDLLHSVLNSDTTFPLPIPMAWQTLSTDPDFYRWFRDMDSGLLHLSGNNEDESPSMTTLNWLSKAATLVIRELRKKELNIAFVFCQKTSTVKGSRLVTRELFGDIIYQLMNIHPEYLRSRSVELHARVEGSDWKSESQETALKAAENTIAKVLDAFKGEKVFFILDRVDQCGHGERESLNLSLLVKCLLRLIKSAPCKLKVLIVSGRKKPPHELGEAEALSELYIRRSPWHQETHEPA